LASKTAVDPARFDLRKQEHLYRTVRGDRPDFTGFDRRFAEWCDKPGNSLTALEKARLANNERKAS
jgi:hypothetical protein